MGNVYSFWMKCSDHPVRIRRSKIEVHPLVRHCMPQTTFRKLTSKAQCMRQHKAAQHLKKYDKGAHGFKHEKIFFYRWCLKLRLLDTINLFILSQKMDIYFLCRHFIRQVHSHKAPLQTHPSYYPTAERSQLRNTNRSHAYILATVKWYWDDFHKKILTLAIYHWRDHT